MASKRGFHLESLTVDPLKEPPIGAIYGQLGSGKSTEIAKAFPHYHWVVTRRTQLVGPASWIASNKAEADKAGIVVPKKVSVIVDARDAQGNSTTDWEKWIRGFADLVASKPVSYVLDEATTLFEWAHQAICDRIPSAGRGMYDRVDAIKDLAQHLLQNSKASGKGAIWICHYNERKIHEEGPKRGTTRHPEGPNFPIGTMITALMRDFDFVWKLHVEGQGEDAQRYLLCHPGEDEVRKTARHGARTREPVDVRGLLERLGYDLK